MKSQLVAFAVVMGSALGTLGQDPTASDPNHGLRLVQTSTTTFSLRWWGVAGESYFVQQKDDLLDANWIYLPVVGTGDDGVMPSLGINAPNNEKLFLRLEVLSYDPNTVDTDGDGMPDAYEVLNYLDYKVTNAALADFDGDGVPDREDARPANVSIGRLSISITSPSNGGALP